MKKKVAIINTVFSFAAIFAIVQLWYTISKSAYDSVDYLLYGVLDELDMLTCDDDECEEKTD